MPQIRTFSSLRHRNYRYLWISSFFYSAAEWVQVITLGWLIFDMTGSAVHVGALGAMRTLPFIVAGPFGGVISDRMDRRKLLIINQMVVATAALALATLVATDRIEIWQLYFLSLVTGTGFAFSSPLRQALVVNSVPAAEIPNAVALHSTAINLNRVLGPAIGGVMIAVVGASANFFIQAACYLGVAAMAYMAQITYKRPSGPRTSVYADLKEATAFIRGSRRLTGLVLMGFIPSLFTIPFSIGIMAVFAKEALGQDSSGLGLLLSMIGLGGLMGTLLVATMRRKSSSDIPQVAAVVGGAISLIIVSQISSVALAIPFLIGIGVSQMLFITTNNSTIHTMTPDTFRGRVISIASVHMGMGPLGGILAGGLADAFDVNLSMVIGGMLTIASVLFIAVKFDVFRAGIRQRDRIQESRKEIPKAVEQKSRT